MTHAQLRHTAIDLARARERALARVGRAREPREALLHELGLDPLAPYTIPEVVLARLDEAGMGQRGEPASWGGDICSHS